MAIKNSLRIVSLLFLLLSWISCSETKTRQLVVLEGTSCKLQVLDAKTDITEVCSLLPPNFRFLQGAAWVLADSRGLLIQTKFWGPPVSELSLFVNLIDKIKLPPVGFHEPPCGQTMTISDEDQCPELDTGYFDESRTCENWFKDQLDRREDIAGFFSRDWRFSLITGEVKNSKSKKSCQTLFSCSSPGTAADCDYFCNQNESRITIERKAGGLLIQISWSLLPPTDQAPLRRIEMGLFDAAGGTTPPTTVLTFSRPIYFPITKCNLPLSVPDLWKCENETAPPKPQVFYLPNTSVWKVFWLDNELYEPKQSQSGQGYSPIARVRSFFEVPFGNRDGICGPVLSIHTRAGKRIISESEIEESLTADFSPDRDVELRSLPPGGYLLKIGPYDPGVTYYKDPCGIAERQKDSVYYAGEDGKISEVFSHLSDNCENPKDEVEFAADLLKIKIFKIRESDSGAEEKLLVSELCFDQWLRKYSSCTAK